MELSRIAAFMLTSAGRSLAAVMRWTMDIMLAFQILALMLSQGSIHTCVFEYRSVIFSWHLAAFKVFGTWSRQVT